MSIKCHPDPSSYRMLVSCDGAHPKNSSLKPCGRVHPWPAHHQPPAPADEGTHVTAERIQGLVDAAAGGPDAAAALGGADMIQVISAFDVPKVLYDPIRRSFYRAPAPTSLLGCAQVQLGGPVVLIPLSVSV